MASPTTITDYRVLSVAERIELIGDIWDSIVAEGWRPPLSDELKTELDRRVAEDRADPDSAIPWEDVRRAARGESR